VADVLPILLDGPMAAEYTGRPETTLRRWVHEGRITRYGPPGQNWYDIDELPERSEGFIPPRRLDTAPPVNRRFVTVGVVSQ
jgi:hypothetical protein